MSVSQYLEWMAFDVIESLDAAARILKLFTGGQEPQGASAEPGANWMGQKAKMLHWFNLFGKKK